MRGKDNLFPQVNTLGTSLRGGPWTGGAGWSGPGGKPVRDHIQVSGEGLRGLCPSGSSFRQDRSSHSEGHMKGGP